MPPCPTSRICEVENIYKPHFYKSALNGLHYESAKWA